MAGSSRVWVTGIGVTSPLGRDRAATMQALYAGERAFDRVTLFDPTGCRSEIAAEMRQLDVAAVAPAGESQAWSRTDAMAVIAAREALADLPPGLDVDLVLGGTTAGMFETEDLLANMIRDSATAKPIDRMASHPLSASVDRMREAVRPFRRARTICSACSSGANAMLLAASWLRTGRATRVLAGGADALCRLTYSGFSCLGALSPTPCQPFDVARRGLTLGEGAGFLLLETEEAMKARGATPIVELRGWAVAAEAHHITNPQASGETAALVMTSALERGGLSPSDVDYVNAHGTATKLNDSMEATAIRTAFGHAADDIGVSSTKAAFGHTLGAAGAIEAAISAIAISRGAMPPNVGLENVDPACELDHVRTTRHGAIRAALSSSFGFGGSDACILLAAVDAFGPPPGVTAARVVVTAGASIDASGVQTHLSRSARDEVAESSIAFEASEHLDLGRARRIDRAGRLSAAVMGAAIEAAALPERGPGRDGVGAIMGAAYGSVDACAKFLHRIEEKGAKFASPAVFPNLLPSSPVAHASIYHRLKGAVFSSADLDATAESAVVTSAELICAGEASAMLAGGVEEASHIVEAVLAPMCSEPREGDAARSEGALTLLLESRSSASERGAAIIAELTWWASWRGPVDDALDTLEPPSDTARVTSILSPDAVRTLLAKTSWAEVAAVRPKPAAGSHECAGGIAIVDGLGAMVAGEIDELLAIGVARDRGYAFVLRSTGAAP